MATRILSSYKFQGQTPAGATIGTVTVNYNSDGTWDFVAPSGDLIVYDGNEARANKLLELCFVGAGGLAAGTKLFGYA